MTIATRHSRVVTLLVSAATGHYALCAGCGSSHTCPDHVEMIRATQADEVDLLFVIDNSSSMTEEQAGLVRQIPRLVDALASGDLDPADGVTRGRDFAPPSSLHVGVVSTDMGTGGFPVTTCNEPNFGDDGVLLHEGNTGAGCSTAYPVFLDYASGTDPLPFARDVACIAMLGTGGCGWEQPLEASLKAITPSTEGPVGAFDGLFSRGTLGHADGANAGFLRLGSLLAIVVVTDEEDCSASDPGIFDDRSELYPGDRNMRCFLYDDRAVHRVERYVDGLLAQRPVPELLVFAIIAGVPPDVIALPGAPTDYDAILADPRMQAAIDPDMPSRLSLSCDVPGTGIAFPPRRLVEVARGLHGRGVADVVQSICQVDYSAPIDAILRALAHGLRDGCLEGALTADAEGRVGCDVVEMPPSSGPITRCESVPGREPIGLDPETGSEICRVAQVPATGGIVGGAPGWYYDDFSMDVRARCATESSPGRRIAFTPGSEPAPSNSLRLECPNVCR